ncbi:MAG TPA: helix-turn-helix transcriptional regulator [Vicinamibacterales bacterium]|nr:helix-turn-helix transcriptional regulator [Vicinamibacterales bacterium]
MPALSYTALFVLQAMAQGHRFGFDIMDATTLPSGTVYPALRRLEAMGLVESDWEDDDDARKAARPCRRYYQLTRPGRSHLAQAEARFRAVSKLFPKRGRA